MKVLVISAAFPPMRTGEATSTFYLCEQLADRGLDIHLLTTKSIEVPSGLPFDVYAVMSNWSWSELPRFVKYIKRCSPDAVLLMYIDFIYNDHPMITFAPTIAKALHHSVPFVTRFENPIGIPPREVCLSTRVVRKAVVCWAGSKDVDYRFGTLLRDSDRVIVLCGRHRDSLEKQYTSIRTKSVLIPPPPNMRIHPENNGAARQCGRTALDIKDGDFVVAYLGYIYPNKGIETLLRAFQIVSKEATDVRLMLMGGDIDRMFPNCGSYVQEMQELAKQLGINEKVTWTGEYRWDNDKASIYLRAADICVLPFDTGAQLNNSSFAAAVAHGLPIVTTQGDSVEEAFIHEKNVFLVPGKLPDAMASAIKSLMDDPELREQLRGGAIELAQEWFSWDSAIERTIAAFS